ncbi:hypothetical protein [Desulfospira joergensenii]|uniref:hypothetical protein n=1 Tax=Desulfospira joergensenii TaxID=53329 RepID=UPI00129472C4|nr:hypothetical protein [Desulfospira joergensenii]
MASKKIDSECYAEVILRNLTAQSEDDGVKICAFAILGNDTDARRLIKKTIEAKFIRYFEYQNWPAIRKDLLEGLEIVKAA